MKYIIVKKDEIDLSKFYIDLIEIIIELLPNGEVNREIGFDINEQIIHKYPSPDFKYGRNGVFDCNVISVDKEDDNKISKSFFDGYWKQKI